MRLLGGYFVVLFGLASIYLLVEGLLNGITGQVIASLMLLSATIYTAFNRPSRIAARARRRGHPNPSLAT